MSQSHNVRRGEEGERRVSLNSIPRIFHLYLRWRLCATNQFGQYEMEQAGFFFFGQKTLMKFL